MKKVIRLTESDLHRIVESSTRRILSELDWKTYASAGEKARDRGDMKYWTEKGVHFPHNVSKAAEARGRAARFYDAAKDAMNRDYGYQQGEYSDEDYTFAGLGGDFDATDEYGPHPVGYKRTPSHPLPQKYEPRFADDMKPEEFFDGNQDAANSFKNVGSELKNYKKGNYEYVPGKGYRLKS